MNNVNLHKFMESGRIELYASEPMTPKLEGLIAEVEAELADGKVSNKFSDVENFLTDLKK